MIARQRHLSYLTEVTSKATFWARHPGLAWSDPNADDSTRIRAALLRPRFHRLLDIATEFGLLQLKREWDTLIADADDPVERARGSVDRIFRNIEKGFADADTRS